MSSDSKYLLKDEVIQETMAWGGPFCSRGAQRMGFPERPSKEDLAKLLTGLLANGNQALRSNAEAKLHHFVMSSDSTVSENFGRKSPDEMRQEMSESIGIIKGPVNEYLQIALGNIRHGAGGKEKEKADLVWVCYPHATNDLGEPHKHFHFVMLEYGVRQNGQTNSLANRNQIFLATERAERIRQELEAERIELRDGHTVEMANGRATIPELQYGERITGGRAKQVDEYLDKNNIERTKAAEDIARAKTRKPEEERQAKTAEELHQHWSKQRETAAYTIEERQRKSKSKWTGIAKETFEVLKATASVFTLAMKYAYTRQGRKVRVNDIDRFLKDIQKGSLKASHKAALRAVLRNGPASMEESIKVAEQAFKQRRQPKIKLKRGDKIVLSAQAREHMTEEQRDGLRRLVQKQGVVIRGLSQGQGY